MMNRNTQRIVIAVIALVLVAVMVLGAVLPALV
jgi:hypothetical protein